MFTRAGRSFRPLVQGRVGQASRSLSTSSSSTSSYNRALIGGTTLALGLSAYALTSERRRVFNDDKVRESVLDQDTLKRPIHKRNSPEQETNVWRENNNVMSGQPRTELPNEKSQSSKPGSTSSSSSPSSSSSSSSKSGSGSSSSSDSGFSLERPKTLAENQPETVVEKATNVIKDKVVPRTPDVSTSVLDQPSLKANVHKREAGAQAHETAPQSDDAAKLVEEKSEEAAQPAQGAFNEETGEINWDCPCLGGMADGPCGEQFKEAFSCFIFSEAEPKGVDCVEKFKHMQDCFRAHPEIYGEEIDDDEPSDVEAINVEEKHA